MLSLSGRLSVGDNSSNASKVSVRDYAPNYDEKVISLEELKGFLLGELSSVRQREVFDLLEEHFEALEVLEQIIRKNKVVLVA